MELHRREYGIELPDYRSTDCLEEIAGLMAGDKHLREPLAERDPSLSGKDIPFSTFQPGLSLLIRVNGLACHVGYVHKPQWFLHTWEGTGGVTQERIQFWRHRILGVYRYHPAAS